MGSEGVRVGRVAVGGDDALVDAPGRFDLDMLLDLEHRLEVGLLLSVSGFAPVCWVRRAR